MAKGKWAQGIVPKAFQWVIQDQLAVCERPGGYGDNHRKVRRQEEVIWVRENGFSFVVSLLAGDDNLEAYDEQGMSWLHWPFTPGLDLDLALPQMYGELRRLLADDKKLLLHMDEVSDRLVGIIGGYLRWTEMVPVTFEAITVAERLFGRQMGPTARGIVTAAERAPKKVPPPKQPKPSATAGEVDGGASADVGSDGEPVLEVVNPTRPR